ncbi:MAG: COX15/CtaA family protein [Gammaproteobacteria bacterium]
MRSTSLYHRLALFTVIVTLVVVVLGAYVRLSDAGLGCPDWPGCYGHVGVPDEHHEIHAANEAFPERPVEAHKAWKEMIHRYVASSLGVLILILAVMAWMRRGLGEENHGLMTFAVVLVIFQGLLGMWTVTLLVKPAIVTAHLLGGLLTLSVMWLLVLRQRRWFRDSVHMFRPLRTLGTLGLGILIVQILLGGWTSTNYAALACTDFPTCHGSWVPDMDMAEGFTLWRGLGIDYEFGVLDAPARVAVHFVHRIGALVTFLYLGALAVVMLRSKGALVRRLGTIIGVLLLTQVGLGIANVLMSLPLPVAVAHNGVAALLLLALVTLNHASRERP